jgi:lipoyl(octanoyl) transferase
MIESSFTESSDTYFCFYYGKKPFAESLRIQANSLNQILGFEYEPTITLGKRAGRDEIKSIQGFEVHETDRGGFATLHSPGQLVIYPVLDLRKLNWSVRRYVEILESTTKTFLDGLGIETVQAKESGVFTNIGKIAFIGIRVEKGISKHGISINIKNNLNLFECIRPCGVSERELDSIQNHKVEVSLEESFKTWSHIFKSYL